MGKTRKVARFQNREEWLAYCDASAANLRDEYKPWILTVREPDVTITVKTLTKTIVEERRGRKIGCVAVVKRPSGYSIGASCCDLRDTEKYNRHEAQYRALTRLHEIPEKFDHTFPVTMLDKRFAPGDITPEIFDTAKFYHRFPKSCREHIQHAIKYLRERDKAKLDELRREDAEQAH